jgi:dUTP pyrophosphatase
MKVKIKKLHEDAVIPQYAKPGDSGFDFVALEDTVITPQSTVMVKTGIAVEIPEGFELQVRPRSGTSFKTPLRVSNSPGTVDSGYRGPCNVLLTNTAQFNASVSIKSPFDDAWYDNNTQFIKKGDRIAQGVICPVIRAEFELVDELSDSERGVSGFGSSGK